MPAASRRAARRRPLRRRHRYALVLAPVGAVLVVLLVGGYLLHWQWTGYLTSDPDEPQVPRPLWEWLTLALQPLALAFVPLLLGRRGRGYRGWRIAGAAAVVVLLVLVVGGYRLGWSWTGFEGNTLWDWLGLFLMPFLLPLVLVLMASSEAPATRARPVPEEPPAVPARPRGRPSRVPPWGYAAGGLAAGVALTAAVGLVLPDRGSPGAAGSGSREVAVPTLVTRAVTVDSRSATWTDTRVRVRKGERVEVAAVGMVLPGPSDRYHWVGPDGQVAPDGKPQTIPGQQSIMDGWPHEELIGTVAAPGRVLSKPRPAPGPVEKVGEHRVLTATRDGDLFLRMNDAKVRDNRGWFGATIRVLSG